jgi:hypothetical protein
MAMPEILPGKDVAQVNLQNGLRRASQGIGYGYAVMGIGPRVYDKPSTAPGVKQIDDLTLMVCLEKLGFHPEFCPCLTDKFIYLCKGHGSVCFWLPASQLVEIRSVNDMYAHVFSSLATEDIPLSIKYRDKVCKLLFLKLSQTLPSLRKSLVIAPPFLLYYL